MLSAIFHPRKNRGNEKSNTHGPGCIFLSSRARAHWRWSIERLVMVFSSVIRPWESWCSEVLTSACLCVCLSVCIIIIISEIACPNITRIAFTRHLWAWLGPPQVLPSLQCNVTTSGFQMTSSVTPSGWLIHYTVAGNWQWRYGVIVYVTLTAEMAQLSSLYWAAVCLCFRISQLRTAAEVWYSPMKFLLHRLDCNNLYPRPNCKSVLHIRWTEMTWNVANWKAGQNWTTGVNDVALINAHFNETKRERRTMSQWMWIRETNKDYSRKILQRIGESDHYTHDDAWNLKGPCNNHRASNHACILLTYCL